MNRRDLLKGFGAAMGASAAGCGVPVNGISGVDAGKLEGIDTFVVLMMENRSFDHLLGYRRLLEGRNENGLTGYEWNPDPAGNRVGVFQLANFSPEDPPHMWDDCHAQWNGGANDGFVRIHAGPSQHEVMGYHVREDIPVTSALADSFAVCDRWHSSVLASTFPNRYHLHGATSRGVRNNVPLPDFTSILDVMGNAGLGGANYFHDLPFQTAYSRFQGAIGIEQFFTDAAAGTLPRLSFVDPRFSGPDANDDHPDTDVRLGQALIGSIYAALAASPQWSRCMFILTYDEHGGFYDHVAPGQTVADEPAFEQLGFRVPAIVAGPSIRAGSVVSTPLEHVSVISTVTRRFGLPSINARVDATNDLSACVDRELAGKTRRAPKLPAIRIPRSELRARYEAGSKHREHPELQDIADQGGVPSHLDRRNDDGRVVQRLLEIGASLGAVELVD